MIRKVVARWDDEEGVGSVDGLSSSNESLSTVLRIAAYGLSGDVHRFTIIDNHDPALVAAMQRLREG